MGQTFCGGDSTLVDKAEETIHLQKKTSKTKMRKKPSITEIVLAPPPESKPTNVTNVYTYHIHRHYHHHPVKNIYIYNPDKTTTRSSNFRISEIKS